MVTRGQLEKKIFISFNHCEVFVWFRRRLLSGQKRSVRRHFADHESSLDSRPLVIIWTLEEGVRIPSPGTAAACFGRSGTHPNAPCSNSSLLMWRGIHVRCICGQEIYEKKAVLCHSFQNGRTPILLTNQADLPGHSLDDLSNPLRSDSGFSIGE